MKPGVHILRHTFCSHLAMRGAPARAIQELAGHPDLATTQRYMHLSPAALDAAIRLLGRRAAESPWRNSGGGGKNELICSFSSGKVVEAAGVEPASENTSSQITTCVSPFSCRSRLETEPSAPAAIPDVSHCHASGRNVAASPLNDDQSRAVGTLKLIAHRLLSGESVVCVRSYVVFPRDLRGAWASARVPRSRTPVEARSPPGE